MNFLETITFRKSVICLVNWQNLTATQVNKLKLLICFYLQLVEFGSPKRHSANQQTYVNPALVQIGDKVTKLGEKVDQQEDKLVILHCKIFYEFY